MSSYQALEFLRLQGCRIQPREPNSKKSGPCTSGRATACSAPERLAARCRITRIMLNSAIATLRFTKRSANLTHGPSGDVRNFFTAIPIFSCLLPRIPGHDFWEWACSCWCSRATCRHKDGRLALRIVVCGTRLTRRKHPALFEVVGAGRYGVRPARNHSLTGIKPLRPGSDWQAPSARAP
jgi:hypothetical protein